MFKMSVLRLIELTLLHCSNTTTWKSCITVDYVMFVCYVFRYMIFLCIKIHQVQELQIVAGLSCMSFHIGIGDPLMSPPFSPINWKTTKSV